MTLIQLLEQFPDDEACRQHLISVRWPDGVLCPRCNCDRTSELPARKQWTCLGCRYRFSATAGTIFHKTHIGLRKWFIAIFIVLNAKKGISSLELNRQLGISQECCWHLCHRIREAMREDHADLFNGVVQADEYYHGGVKRKPNQRIRYGEKNRPDGRVGNTTGGRGADRQPVLGAVEVSSGRIRTEAVNDASGDTIEETLDPWIDEENAELHTDQFPAYRKYGRRFRDHRVVNHSVEYVTHDGVHTNAVENAWSLFNRAVVGSFHYVSRKHLHRYLSEFDARFNGRSDGIGDLLNRTLESSIGRRLSIAQLVGQCTP